MATPVLRTERLRLDLPAAEHAGEVVAFYDRNFDHFAPWNPALPLGFHTEAFWVAQLARNRADLEQGRSCRFFLWDDRDRVVGSANVFNIVRGALQCANIGYALDKDHEGQGLMSEGLRAVIAYAFKDMGLHRLQADHLPHNHRSAALLRRLGFRVEGYARDFLLMADGAWHDHVRTALVRQETR